LRKKVTKFFAKSNKKVTTFCKKVTKFCQGLISNPHQQTGFFNIICYLLLAIWYLLVGAKHSRRFCYTKSATLRDVASATPKRCCIGSTKLTDHRNPARSHQKTPSLINRLGVKH